jgi:cation transport ATPase
MTTNSRDGEYDAREQISQAEQAEAERGRAARATSLFDLRRVIGGLLAAYGAMLTVIGLFASAGTKAKAAGININLWAGLAMLVVGLAFLAWAFLRPLRAEDLAEEDEEGASSERDEQARAR